eukprot:TRINITY_DN811_c0_g1_i2.p1 TRINITY_DN811_c0_g1~~TRINITY_DN811_c0_g1_i2.p1  ORF type:complete len:563 (+),score=120.76 TRINITY_DN811_c0_g1_i2:817-2505(+)
MAKKIDRFRRNLEANKEDIKHNDAHSRAATSSDGDHSASEPPAAAAAMATEDADSANVHQRSALPSTKVTKGIIHTDGNKYIGRLWLGNKYLCTPECGTVQEAAFMRNCALETLFPGEESRRTVIKGGLHFPPEQERRMRETIAKHLSKLGLTAVGSACNSQASESEQAGEDNSDDSSYAGPQHAKLPAMTGVRRSSARLRNSATGDVRNSKNQTGFNGVQGRNSCFHGTVYMKHKKLRTPKCKTAVEAAFMRNIAVEVLYPGDEARLTVIPGGIDFSPRQQAAMRKTMTDKARKALPSRQPTKLSSRMDNGSDSTGNNSHRPSATSNDDVKHCPPPKRQRRRKDSPGRRCVVPGAGAVDDKALARQMLSTLPPVAPTALALSELMAPLSQHAVAEEHRPVPMPQQAAAEQQTPGVRPQQQLMLQEPQRQHMMQQGELQMAEGAAIKAPRFTEVQRRARQVQARGRNALQLLSAAESMRDAPNDLVVNTIAIVVQQLAPLPQAFENEPLLAQFVALRQRALEVQVHGESAMQMLTSAEHIPQAPTEFVEHIVALAEQELEGL